MKLNKNTAVWLISFIAISLALASCGGFRVNSINQRDDISLKRAKLGYSQDTMATNFYRKSLNLTYAQIAKGEVKTDGQGLYVVIGNESRVNINTIIVGPIPVTGVVDLGIIPENTALALFQSGEYNHRSYYLEESRDGVANYDEDYLPPGKYVSFSSYRGQIQGHGWCFDVTTQLQTYKKMKVHGYTVFQ